jgi:hypothetical protein
MAGTVTRADLAEASRRGGPPAGLRQWWSAAGPGGRGAGPRRGGQAFRLRRFQVRASAPHGPQPKTGLRPKSRACHQLPASQLLSAVGRGSGARQEGACDGARLPQPGRIPTISKRPTRSACLSTSCASGEDQVSFIRPMKRAAAGASTGLRTFQVLRGVRGAAARTRATPSRASSACTRSRACAAGGRQPAGRSAAAESPCAGRRRPRRGWRSTTRARRLDSRRCRRCARSCWRRSSSWTRFSADRLNGRLPPADARL